MRPATSLTSVKGAGWTRSKISGEAASSAAEGFQNGHVSDSVGLVKIQLKLICQAKSKKGEFILNQELKVLQQAEI